MAKKILKRVKLQIAAGKATPAPPLGPALGQAGINIAEFVKKFNDATGSKAGKGKLVVAGRFGLDNGDAVKADRRRSGQR